MPGRDDPRIGRRASKRVPSGERSRAMDSVPRKRRTAFALAIALPIVLVVAFIATRGTGGRSGAAESERRARAHLAEIPESPPSPAVPASPEEIDKRVEAALGQWRTAILIRDADMLLKVEAAFLEAPATYLEALKKSAASDDNERVRAFSTRELGKVKQVDLAPVFRQLLDDKSPFVRKNAAWGLGELGAADEGRAAAGEAIPKLRQVVKRDRADEVRDAARIALDRLE
jgi:hypothetical protein